MGFARSSCVPQYFHADIMIKRRKFGSALLVGDKILIDFLIDFFVLTERLQHNIAERFLISHFILLLPLLRDVEQPIHLRLLRRTRILTAPLYGAREMLTISSMVNCSHQS